MSSSGNNTVFLVTGVVAESFLREPFDSGYTGDKCVHQLWIIPFSQEFQLLVAYLGASFGLQEMVGPVAGPTFNLSTRKEGATSVCESWFV
jgi:hypothetical protein